MNVCQLGAFGRLDRTFEGIESQLDLASPRIIRITADNPVEQMLTCLEWTSVRPPCSAASAFTSILDVIPHHTRPVPGVVQGNNSKLPPQGPLGGSGTTDLRVRFELIDHMVISAWGTCAIGTDQHRTKLSSENDLLSRADVYSLLKGDRKG